MHRQLTRSCSRLLLVAVLFSAFLPRESEAQAVIRQVTVKNFQYVAARQLATEWCWAACIQMILNYHRVDWTQYDIVAAWKGYLVDASGQDYEIATFLNSWSFTHGGQFWQASCQVENLQTLTLRDTAERWVNELSAQRPFILGVKSFTASHVVIVWGASYVSTATGPRIVSINIFDPWYGRADYVTGDQLAQFAWEGSAQAFYADVRVSSAPTVAPPPVSVEASLFTRADGVLLTWRPSPGADSYQVWRGATSDVLAGTIIAMLPNTLAYLDVQPAAGQTVYYRVRALSAGRPGPWSNAVRAGVAVNPVRAPFSVTASYNAFTDRVAIRWLVAEAGLVFDVFRSVDGFQNDNLVVANAITATQFDDFTAEPEIEYQYRVQSFKRTGPGTGQLSPFSAVALGRRARLGGDRLRWRVSMKGPGNSGAPALSEDRTVYFLNNSSLLAVDQMTGFLLWEKDIGGITEGGPAIGRSGEILTTSYSFGDTYLRSFNPINGALKYAANALATQYSAPAVTAAGDVIVNSWKNVVYKLGGSGGTIGASFNAGPIAFDPDAWATKAFNSSPAVGAQGSIFVGDFNGYIRSLSGSDLRESWKFRTVAAVESSPTLGESLLYCGANDGYIYCLQQSNGAQVWKYKTGGRVAASAAIQGSGDIVCGSYDGKLYSLNGKTGKLNWSANLVDAIGTAPCVGDDGVVYAAAGNFIHAVRGTDGTILWRFDAGSYTSSAALNRAGVLFFTAGEDAYAIQTSSGGLAASPWPRARRGDQNTGALVVTPPQLRVRTTGLVLDAGLTPGDSFVVQVSRDLQVWTDDTSLTVPDSLATLVKQIDPGEKALFFRVISR